MSSSSSAEPLARSIEDALDSIAIEYPAGLDDIRRCAGELTVAIDVDGDRCRVAFHPSGIVVAADGPTPGDIVVRTDRATIVSVMTGRVGLADAVDDGRLDVVGDLSVIVVALDVLVLFTSVSVHVAEQQLRLRRFTGAVGA